MLVDIEYQPVLLALVNDRLMVLFEMRFLSTCKPEMDNWCWCCFVVSPTPNYCIHAYVHAYVHAYIHSYYFITIILILLLLTATQVAATMTT